MTAQVENQGTEDVNHTITMAELINILVLSPRENHALFKHQDTETLINKKIELVHSKLL